MLFYFSHVQFIIRKKAVANSNNQVYKFIWIISGLHVNNKRISNNIHTKTVLALTSCDNTVITNRWKKESRRTTLNLIRPIVVPNSARLLYIPTT